MPFISCFYHLLPGPVIINLAFRGEGCSRASGERKNSGRNNSKVKMLLGRKCDGIVRELGSPEEYAISDNGLEKYLADGSLKLPKVMQDVLHQKLRKHGIRLVRSCQMEIVGFLHSGRCFVNVISSCLVYTE